MKRKLRHRWSIAIIAALGTTSPAWSAPPPSSLPSPKATVKSSEATKTADTSWFNWIGNTSTSAKESTPEAAEKISSLSAADEREMMIDITRASNYQSVGEFDKARKIYKDLRERFPNEAEPAYRLGVVADEQRKHQEAERLFAFAVQVSPQNANYAAALGYCYFLQGKFRESEAMLVRAAHLAPKNVRIRNNLALAMGQQGKYGDALKQFAACGSEADAYFNLAYIYALQDKTEEAKQCFRKALTIDPTHQKARDGLASFVRYESLPAHMQEGEDYLDDRGMKWVPYYENGTNSSSSSAMQTSAELPTSRSMANYQRQLQQSSQSNQAANMKSQRE